MDLSKQLSESFVKHFGERPSLIVRAPGRVNLIGEHTDYNDGFVLPMAIDRAIWIAVRPRTDRFARIHSVDFEAEAVFSLDDLKKEQGWAEYLKGIAHILQAEGYKLSGWDGVMMGDVPRGSGLSSSAAVEMATARVFASVSNLKWDAAYMARIGQRAENRACGADENDEK